ncbi:MAG: hypothetical protein QOG13_2709 [Sphingomonadales bacterium]|jgi:hypothetical protein|nr:hypothetical protein [Sphingomonadales bacterium]MEA3044043.1 hypothetical protein [Sphingomonadales bacterium]
MAEIKTKPTGIAVDAFLDAVPDPQRREDGKVLREMFERISGEPAAMWGPSIVGFGSYSYRYESGHGGEMCRIGYSPRAKELVLYIGATAPGVADLLARLGKHKTGKSCLYVKRLKDIDLDVLERMIAAELKRTPAGC